MFSNVSAIYVKKIMDGFDKYTNVAGLEDKDGFKRRKDFTTCFGSYIVGWTVQLYAIFLRHKSCIKVK